MSHPIHLFSDNLFYFLTFVISGRKSVFNQDKPRKIIKENLQFYRNKFEFLLPAYVVMPDHLQFIVGFKKNDDLSQFVHNFKSFTAQEINKFLDLRGEFWQKDYWDHGIRNEKDLIEKINYIHKNPLEIVDDIEKWPWCSYHNYYCDHPCWFEIDKILI